MHVSGLHVLFCLHDMSLSCKFLFPAIIMLNKEVKMEDENVAISLCLIIIIPPAYEVYRGYIVFVFSVIVCVCVNFFFSSKISQKLLHLGF